MASSKADPSMEGNDVGTRTETFLGEFRMIIPAMAAILGFQLMVAFQQSFAELGRPEQVASFLALACTAAAFLLLLMPASYHRFTWEFEETEEFLRFSRRSIGAAFVFMPLVVSLTLYVQGVQVFGSRPLGAAIGIATLASALIFWWGIPLTRARKEGYLPHARPIGHRRPASSKAKQEKRAERENREGKGEPTVEAKAR
ncbi:MAG TPA: DUF6328 family protein [Candidatus Thermoplasmatota archaeon]|nr:DUF6328 family protein [Candidatus Thermoplasmatota archaeon]